MLDAIKNKLPLNFALMSNPVNWVIIVLMIALASLGLALVFNSAKQQGNDDE